jgi:hypothetical protein
MQSYWVTFEDGSAGCCSGQSPVDAKNIAEKLTGKKVPSTKEWITEQRKVGKCSYMKETFDVKPLPYPATPIIWQFDHPVYGKCPAFCYSPKQCAGRTSCPKSHACDD